MAFFATTAKNLKRDRKPEGKVLNHSEATHDFDLMDEVADFFHKSLAK